MIKQFDDKKVFEWCNEYLVGNYVIVVTPSPLKNYIIGDDVDINIHFDNIDDATLFKLTW